VSPRKPAKRARSEPKASGARAPAPAAAGQSPAAPGPVELAALARRGVGLFELPHRGIVEVAGDDRVRWLDGMLTNDVSRLRPGPEGSGCRALVLDRKGGIVADVHVWLRPAALWLEADAAALPGLLEHLRRLVVADDVRLAALGPAIALLALEGPAAAEVLARAAGRELPLAAGRELPLAEGAVAEVAIAGAAAVVAAYGESGEVARRIAVPADAAARVAGGLAAAGRPLGLVAGSAEALEILRIEAGTPRFGAELAAGVLPAEARLEAAIDFDKGCYTGQEIVARVASRGEVRRRLAGLRLGAGAAPAPGDPIEAAGLRVGEVTSGCVSPACGAIGLGFVRRPADAPGTELHVGGRPARAAALPFVRPAAVEGARGPA
jgi:folate-binding protein YgfZ